MTFPHSARTAAACRIIGIDRQKLTDAIANGDYPCAPATVSGVARVFDVPALIALHTFFRLTNDGFPARIAGKFACMVQDGLQADPDQTHIAIDQPVMGSPHISLKELATSPPPSHVGGLPLRYRMVFDLRSARKMILHGLMEEAGIVGEDDESTSPELRALKTRYNAGQITAWEFAEETAKIIDIGEHD